MKISGLVIQNKKITLCTETDFEATYKGKLICITTNHGHRKPKHDFLLCYDIVVIDIRTGLKDVNTYEDFHNIQDAIRCALQGACLLDLSY